MRGFRNFRAELFCHAKRFASDRTGNFSIIFSLALPAFVLLTGVAVDTARVIQAKSDLQSAMDSAVLAAVPLAAASRDAKALLFLTANMPANVTLGTPAWATNSDNSYTGQVTAAFTPSFMSIAGIRTVTIGAKSTATLGKSTNSVCILVKDPSANQALLVNSGVTINASKCEIHVASTGSPAAIFNSSSTFNVSKICVKGSNVTQNGGTVPALKTNCSTASDPFAGTLPSISTGSCSVSNQNYSGSNTLSPGTYCGNFNFNGNGTLNLSSGLYVFSNTHWNLNSGWTVTGTGVTFYFADSNSYIQVNSGVTMNISAPTSGTYANILMYEPTNLSTSSFSVNGSAGHTFAGLIYLPSRNITFNSMSNVSSESLTMVVNQLILDTINWNISPGVKTISATGASGSGSSHLSY